ncbi:universal stress protein [Halomarina litorea]|uniref:universal stress protein n=1 Tax=Halomarina litorea TaxID=2961595 RepID=UPI0020C30FBE|nr:universal stress protein [Halomarina sp. BCD28]
MYHDILVPTDGSDGARVAVDHALDLATTFDARLHALYVVNPMYASDLAVERVIDALTDVGERATDDIADRARAAGVECVTRVERGPAYRRIVEYVENNDVDLVVMGTHGRTGLDRYLLGSVTEKVVRLSPVPVLTVRMTDEDEE